MTDLPGEIVENYLIESQAIAVKMIQMINFLDHPINVSILIGSLGVISRYRPQYLSMIILALDKFSRRATERYSNAHWRSICKTLILEMCSMIKIPDSAPFHGRLINILADLGAGKEAERIRHRYSRTFNYQPVGTYIPHILDITPNVQKQLQELSNLPLNLVSNIVIESIKSHQCPDITPVPKMVDSGLLYHLLSVVQPLASLPVQPPIPLGDSPIVKLIRDNPLKRRRELEEFTPSKKRHMEVEISMPSLTQEDLQRFAVQSFERIIKEEKGVIKEGKAEIRKQTLARLAKSLPMSGEPFNNFIEHIIDDIDNRHDLALKWLYQEWINPDHKRYHHILQRLITAMKNLHLIELFPSFLIRLPEVTEDVFHVIDQCCKTPSTVDLGLNTLRDLITLRPPCRNQSIDMLLEYTSHMESSIRRPAIILTRTKIYSNPLFSDRIQEYATNLP
eukprot:TRINITY_DN230_c2_g2_i3.p1 TRINITY_DN230_c2_g2~~TRINITY_DN230_c2_g2_i3.p1  ORF type:complete len:466 (+),score=81.03 TRINITY_DN230_c2_g2_i3:50-1399(+)